MCVDGLGYVFVCESYVVLDQCDKPPSLFVLSVCAYGGVVRYFRCLAFCVSFISCIVVMMSGWVMCTRFLDFVSGAVYVDLKYDDVFVLLLIVACQWVVVCL